MKHSLFLAAVEATAKTVRTLLTTPQLTRPFRQPFTPECMRAETWLQDKEAEEEVSEPVSVEEWRDLLGHSKVTTVEDGTCLRCGLEQYSRGEGVSSDWLFKDDDADPWWSVEAVKARARAETPLSATFYDEPACLRCRAFVPVDKDSGWCLDCLWAHETPAGMQATGPVAPEEARHDPASSGVPPFTMSERGFRHYQPVITGYGHTVKVYESSAASAPHIWLAIDAEGAATPNPYAHCTVEQAIAIRDQLNTAIREAQR